MEPVAQDTCQTVLGVVLLQDYSRLHLTDGWYLQLVDPEPLGWMTV
jgi:hypothetical protein